MKHSVTSTLRLIRAAALVTLLFALATAQSQDQAGPPASSAQSMPQPAADVVQLPVGAMRIFLAKKVNPAYPPRARKDRIEGTVTLNARINKQGDVVHLKPVSGDPLLVQAAANAVWQWKYRPYVVDGRPVEVETQIQVNFSLTR